MANDSDANEAPVLDLNYWNERWREGQTGWIESNVNAALRAHIEVFSGCKRVLVPLCGNSADLQFLAGHDLEVIGVEGVAQAAERFFAERGITPQREPWEGLPSYHHGGIRIVVADIFSLEPARVLADAVYDRAAMVAVDPSKRRDYVAAVSRWASEQVRSLVVVFEHDLRAPDAGPPFAIFEPELQTLVSPRTLTFLRRTDLADQMPRMRARGATFLRETSWLVG